MSKFLKFIVALILIVFIGAGAALIVPQFVGDMDPIIVQEKMVSNKAVGTVIYTQKEETADLQIGDKVLDMDSNTLYVHEVVSYDSVSQTAQVTGSPATTVRLSENYTRAVFSVPLIGYLTIATQSLPGLILLGLLLGLVILLFIASEVLRRSGDEDDDEEEEETTGDDDDFYAGLAKRKRETETLAPVTESLHTATEATNEEGPEREGNNEPDAPTGLFVEEEKELDRIEREETADATEATKEEAAQANGGMLELSKEGDAEEERAEGVEEKPLGTGELPDVQAALEAALENQQLNRSDRPTGPTRATVPETPVEEAVLPNAEGEIELAMPVHTVEDLMAKAYAEGLDPKVRKDEQHGVTFVDYSDSL